MKVENRQMKYHIELEGFDDINSVFCRDIQNEELKEKFRREFLEKNPRLRATVKRLKITRAPQEHDENAGRAFPITERLKEELEREGENETDEDKGGCLFFLFFFVLFFFCLFSNLRTQPNDDKGTNVGLPSVDLWQRGEMKC